LFAAPENEASFVVHILGYIRKDYGGAVENGKVKSKFEYEEQIEFVKAAIQSAKGNAKLKDNLNVLSGLETLHQGILKKVSADQVAKEAGMLEAKVIEVASLEVAPLRWPDRAHGKKLYKQSCTSCHGAEGHGDGPAGRGLEPPPADFYAQGMFDSTPYQLFNTIRLGVPGTGMAAFSELSDREVWDLAFYLVSLRHEPAAAPGKLDPGFSLAQVANSTDNELLEKLSGTLDEKKMGLAQLRLHSLPSQGSNDSIKVARAKLDETLAAVQRGDFKAAKQAAVMAYLDGVEPIEPKLRNKDEALTILIEEKMGNLRAAIDAGMGVGAIENRIGEVREVLARVEKTLDSADFSPTVTFWVAMGIFTREAFEAILIIITLLGVIRSLGSRKAALYVNGGWVLALSLGVLGWIFSGWLMNISGAQREILEGTVAFLAVAVLLYFGFWLHRRTEIGRWTAFLKDMTKNAVEGKNLLALGFVSFMAVFREAFETILFLRALVLETGPSHHFAVLGGVLVAFVFVLVLAVVLVKYSVRLPLRQLFSISSAILLILSFMLLGKGVHAFQEVGMIGTTLFPISLRWDFLGIYPTYESWIPQLILLAGATAVWLHGRFKPALPTARVSKSS